MCEKETEKLHLILLANSRAPKFVFLFCDVTRVWLTDNNFYFELTEIIG